MIVGLAGNQPPGLPSTRPSFSWQRQKSTMPHAASCFTLAKLAPHHLLACANTFHSFLHLFQHPHLEQMQHLQNHCKNPYIDYNRQKHADFVDYNRQNKSNANPGTYQGSPLAFPQESSKESECTNVLADITDTITKFITLPVINCDQ